VPSSRSAVKKSHARIASAWERRNCGQVGAVRRGAGSIPALFRISHTVDAAIFTPRPASSPWIIFSFGPKDNAILHDVVATEGLKASFYIEDQQETYLHLLVFNTLLEAALDATASRDLILQIAESHWRG
jgi:hypothetical protein